MIVTVQLTHDASQTLKELQREFPAEFGKGMSAVGARLKSRMAKEMAAGDPAGRRLANLNENTMALRRVYAGFAKKSKRAAKLAGGDLSKFRGKTKASNKFGGALPGLIRYKWDRGTQTLQVGWIPGTVSGGNPTVAAARFQAMAGHVTKTKERYWFHKRRIAIGSHVYHPAREVIRPFREDQTTSDEVLRIVNGSIKHWLEKKSARQQAKAVTA